MKQNAQAINGHVDVIRSKDQIATGKEHNSELTGRDGTHNRSSNEDTQT